MSVKSIDRTVERIQRKFGIDEEEAATIKHMLESVVESRDRRIRHIEARITRAEADFAPTVKKITGALRSTIQAHGPITEKTICSAAKRITGQCLEVNGN